MPRVSNEKVLYVVKQGERARAGSGHFYASSGLTIDIASDLLDARAKISKLRETLEGVSEWCEWEKDPAAYRASHDGWEPLIPWRMVASALDTIKADE